METVRTFLIRFLSLFKTDYFKRFLILKEKPRLFIFLGLYVLIMWGVSGGSMLALVIALLLMLILLNIAMSRIIERLLRRVEDARHVATSREKERLNELFKSVLEDTNMGEDIQIYIIDTASINAMAVGKSVLVNRGLLDNMSDGELSGVIAHELGHIKNFDTTIYVIINIFLFMFLGIFYILNFIFNFIKNLSGEGIISWLVGLIQSVFNLVIQFGNFLAMAIISGSSREAEYEADKFALKHGYGSQLIEALYTFYDLEISDKKKLIEQIYASHPKTAYRIEKLEQMV